MKYLQMMSTALHKIKILQGLQGTHVARRTSTDQGLFITVWSRLQLTTCSACSVPYARALMPNTVTHISTIFLNTFDLQLVYARPVAFFYRPLSHMSTLTNWISQVMSSAGIDTTVFTPHSVRGASISAVSLHVLLATILKTAGCSSSCTFCKYYQKPIEPSFSKSILESSKSQGPIAEEDLD